MNRPAGYIPVAHTCPTLDRLRALVRRHMGNAVARDEALALIETIRGQNEQLRANAAAYSWVYHGGEDDE